MLKWKTVARLYTYFKIHNAAAHYDTDRQKYLCSFVKRKVKYYKEK